MSTDRSRPLSRETGSRSLSPAPALTRQRQRSNHHSRSRSPISPITDKIRRLRKLTSHSSTTSSPTKQKKVLRSVSADRDRRYFNILGTDGLVSTDHVLQELQLTNESDSITKLELEDIVVRKQDHQEIFDAIQQLISLSNCSCRDNNDNDKDSDQQQRSWMSIKFVDTIRFFSDDSSYSSSSMSKLLDYETKQQKLWDMIIDNCNEEIITKRCLLFEANIMIDQGSSIESIQEILLTLQSSRNNIERIDFGGGLYGCSDEEVPDKLASLFQKETKASYSRNNNYSQEDPLFLSEMVTINLCYAPTFLGDTEKPEVMKKCRYRMGDLKTELKRERSASPKRTRSQSPKSSPKSPTTTTKSRSQSPKPSSSSGRTEGLDTKIKEAERESSKVKPMADISDKAASHQHRSSRHGRRRRRRQNSMPETDPDIVFVRKNTPDFRWDKMEDYQDAIKRSSIPSAA